MKILRWPILFLLILLAGCSTISKGSKLIPQTASYLGKFEPPNGQVLLMIGQDKDSLDNYVRGVKVVPAGIMFYTAIQDTRALDGPFDPDGGGVQDFPYLMKHYPRAVLQVGLYMVGALDQVINGSLDHNIEKMGRVLKQTDRPVYLRIGYEFDNPDNAYDPKKYVQAFHYIVDKFRRMNVSNVAYVWHSYAVIHPKKPITDWYPGDDYVDWVAISFFGPYNTDNMNKVAQFARDHHKPFMIAEATPAGFTTANGEDTWKRWYSFVFKYIEEQHVKVFCYINCFWDPMPEFASLHWGDSRVEKNDAIKTRWLGMISQKEFLEDSADLFKKLNYSSH